VDRKLEDRVSLQDAFDLAKEMQPDSENDSKKYEESDSGIERVETERHVETAEAKAEDKHVESDTTTKYATTTKIGSEDSATTYTVVPKTKVVRGPTTCTNIFNKDDTPAKNKPIIGGFSITRQKNAPRPAPVGLVSINQRITLRTQRVSLGSPNNMATTTVNVPNTDIVERSNADIVVLKKDPLLDTSSKAIETYEQALSWFYLDENAHDTAVDLRYRRAKYCGNTVAKHNT
jgi:hypothetical protein